MNFLLDIHVFLWWLDDPQLLSKAVRKAIGDGKNTVSVSAVIWGIAIKKALGKIDAPDDLEAAVVADRFLSLPVTTSHALAVNALPDHHRDPFDRMLIAHFRHEGFKLLEHDKHVTIYDVPYIVV